MSSIYLYFKNTTVACVFVFVCVCPELIEKTIRPRELKFCICSVVCLSDKSLLVF